MVKVDGIDFYSDPWRIAEILRNLISNAIKYRKLDQVLQKLESRSMSITYAPKLLLPIMVSELKRRILQRCLKCFTGPLNNQMVQALDYIL
jgi:signal transduction histidine kinase